jgi:hypothetical protein
MSSDQYHDDLEPIVEKIQELHTHMGEVGRRIETRDAKHHTGSGAWLVSFNQLMRA